MDNTYLFQLSRGSGQFERNFEMFCALFKSEDKHNNFFFLLQYYCGILNNITLLGAKGKIKGGYFMVVFLYSP